MKHLILTIGFLAMASGAFAEDRAVVFVHGLASQPSTWDAVVSRLAPTLAMQAGKATLDSRALYETQATALQQQFGGWRGIL